MNKKYKRMKSSTCKVKRMCVNLALIVTHSFETVWAAGVSVAAAMAFSTSTH